jgi:hypothetical protein
VAWWFYEDQPYQVKRLIAAAYPAEEISMGGITFDQMQRGWSNSQRDVHERPSEYYYRQITSCFFEDSVGIINLDPVAKELFGHLDDTTVFDIVRGNAVRLLGLELSDGSRPAS